MLRTCQKIKIRPPFDSEAAVGLTDCSELVGPKNRDSLGLARAKCRGTLRS